MSCIHYKFRSSLEYDTITFDGLAISLGDLKKSIMAQKKIAKVTDFDLEVTNAQTKEEYKDESTQIPKNSSVVVRRIPTGSRSKAQLAVDRGDTYASGLPKTKSEELTSTISAKQTKIIDLVNSDASEEDKLKVMMSQAGEGYQPNQYVKGRGRGYNPSGPLPPNYVCYRCGKPGHFIRNCPTNGVKRTIGIPRKFGEETAVETTDESIIKKDPVKKLVPVQDTTAVKDRKVPSELKCPMCSNLLHDAVLIPCCGTSYCDECIRTYLLENDQECPTCGAEDVSPDSLIINKQLRQAVNNFRNARPASPFVNSSTDKSTSDKSATSTVDSPAQNNDKSISSPSLSVVLPDVRSPDTSEKEKSEEKVTSTTSEIPSKDTPELKKEELKKEALSPVVVKEEVNSPRPDQSSDSEDRRGSNIKHQPAATGGNRPEPSGYGQHPMHRGPGMIHPMVGEPVIPRSIAPEGAIVVPPIRTARPVLHAAPLIQQPGFIAATSMGIHPVVTGHSSMVHPTLQPHLLGSQFPFAMKRPHPFDDGGPPMSEEEFYRYQKKMKIRNKRKHRDKERLRERGSRERSRERQTNKSHPANFDDELSQYRALQRHRHGNYRSRSHSRSRSVSRSLSRSLSQSSHTMSKSPTPEDWDRSRTPSPSSQVLSDSKNPEGDGEKKHKRKKRKKHHKNKHSKKRKSEHNAEEESIKENTTTTVKSEKKSKSKKRSKEKSQKKEKMDTKNTPDSKGNTIESQEKEIANDPTDKQSDIPKVENDTKQSKESIQTEDKGNEQNGTEPEPKEVKKTKKKSDESKEKSKHKSKEKSGEKKHKKKKHKRKHKKHKKEKDKSQSTEEKSESTEETQDSEGENGQQHE